VERNRIIPAIIIDFQSGGFWGVSPPQNPERLFLWKIVTIKGMKSHTWGGSKLVGKKGQFSTGIFMEQLVKEWKNKESEKERIQE
jgi:hypothetical protein